MSRLSVRSLGLAFSLCWLLISSVACGDEPATAPEEPDTTRFVLTDEVKEALLPLFKSIADADVSRVTVQLSADSVLGGLVMESQTSTYQIGSVAPDKFTVYLKEPQHSVRVFCDGQEMVVAMSPTAFFRAPEVIQTQRAVTELPVPMGPYPEAVLSLSLAGVDPAISLLGGMQSVTLVDRPKFRGEVDSVHFKGIQSDGVTWDFWMTPEDQPRPLRLLVDLTPMLRASNEVQVPPNFSYQLRFDFLSWRMSGSIDDALFKFSPAKDAVEYKSLEDYYQSIDGVATQHPLLGLPAPAFQANTLDGKTIDADALQGKVVIADFWATWCAPCIASVPVLTDINSNFDSKQTVLLLVNTGEKIDVVEKFVKEHDWKGTVLLDPEGKIAQAFQVDAIPQTVIIGPTGNIESVHVGFDGEETLRSRLTSEIETLLSGKTLAKTSEE